MADIITKEMIVNDIIKKYPKTLAVFGKFKIDSCCGGRTSIEIAGKRDGADVDAMVKELNRAAAS